MDEWIRKCFMDMCTHTSACIHTYGYYGIILCLTLCDPMDYSPWNSPGQNTGVGSLSFLQGIFPTQGLNPGLPHCGQILYQLSHKGSPTILEWVAYPFSRGSSQPRYQTRVSYTAGWLFINWAIREAQVIIFRHKREENPAICNSVYGPWKHYAK